MSQSRKDSPARAGRGAETANTARKRRKKRSAMDFHEKKQAVCPPACTEAHKQAKSLRTNRSGDTPAVRCPQGLGFGPCPTGFPFDKETLPLYTFTSETETCVICAPVSCRAAHGN